MMGRRPNTQCDGCAKPLYRRPGQMAQGYRAFCSKECRARIQLWYPPGLCPSCGEIFRIKEKGQKFCSRSCANQGRTGIRYSKDAQGNKSRKKLAQLHQAFDFTTCMIEDCTYNKTFDIHRLVEGKNGGEYVIGNMFAICPNHHAEITRGLVIAIRVDDQNLRIHGRVDECNGFESRRGASLPKFESW